MIPATGTKSRISWNGLSVISDGLQSGDRIVVEGQYRLIDGAKVKIGAPAQAQAGEQATQ